MADRAVQEALQEAKGILYLLLYLEVYGQILLHFSAKAVLDPLQ